MKLASEGCALVSGCGIRKVCRSEEFLFVDLLML
jgi:hypothetical protein